MTHDQAGRLADGADRDTPGTTVRQTNENHRPVIQGRKFIVFVAGGANYAVDSRAVSEVFRDLKPSRLPNSPEWLLGVANLRSEIVTVVELGRLLGGDPVSAGQTPKHIVVRIETMDALIAFRVEKLKEIVTIEKSRIRSASDPARPFVSGEFEHRKQAFTVINVGKLVESLTLT